jgi:hypothetical protein
MVTIKQISKQTYRPYGFSSKQAVIAYLKANGSSGRMFETEDKLKDYLEQSKEQIKIKEPTNKEILEKISILISIIGERLE